MGSTRETIGRSSRAARVPASQNVAGTLSERSEAEILRDIPVEGTGIFRQQINGNSGRGLEPL
ncbi:MAG: hypothetical protein VX593_06775, partial [Pseudomonadota bacterium]|nr:hypothetical protein [Pseudomonadota bacterium]